MNSFVRIIGLYIIFLSTASAAPISPARQFKNGLRILDGQLSLVTEADLERGAFPRHLPGESLGAILVDNTESTLNDAARIAESKDPVEMILGANIFLGMHFVLSGSYILQGNRTPALDRQFVNFSDRFEINQLRMQSHAANQSFHRVNEEALFAARQLLRIAHTEQLRTIPSFADPFAALLITSGKGPLTIDAVANQAHTAVLQDLFQEAEKVAIDANRSAGATSEDVVSEIRLPLAYYVLSKTLERIDILTGKITVTDEIKKDTPRELHNSVPRHLAQLSAGFAREARNLATQDLGGRAPAIGNILERYIRVVVDHHELMSPQSLAATAYAARAHFNIASRRNALADLVQTAKLSHWDNQLAIDAWTVYAQRVGTLLRKEDRSEAETFLRGDADYLHKPKELD